MTIYKTAKEFPQWFKNRDYSVFKKASLSYILKELYARRFVSLEMAHGDLCPEAFDELFTDRTAHVQELNFTDNVQPEPNIELLNATAMITYGKHFGSNEEDPFSDANCNNFNIYNGEGIIVGINLAHATDAEIKAELSSKLAEFRNKSNFKKQPSRIHMDLQLQKLRSGDLFKYLDLFLWAEQNGYKIHNYVYAKAIDEGKYDADYISNYLSKDAQRSISLQFIEKLERKIESEIKS